MSKLTERNEEYDVREQYRGFIKAECLEEANARLEGVEMLYDEMEKKYDNLQEQLICLTSISMQASTHILKHTDLVAMVEKLTAQKKYI